MTVVSVSRKDIQYMQLCLATSHIFSTCGKRQYSAVLVDELGHVVGMGYNGGPSGFTHCKDGGCPRLLENSPNGSSYENCFSGETKFITRYGIKTLAETVGQSVEVLTSKGWAKAQIESFGVQPLRKVVLKRYNEVKEIYATGSHRWFTFDSHRRKHEVITDNLVEGHYLAAAYPRTGAWQPSVEGIKAGLIFGDGSTSYDQPGSGSFITLYGESVSFSQYWGTDPSIAHDGIRFGNMPRLWKTEAPSLHESYEYLAGWLAGYIAADGSVTRGTVYLHSVDIWRLQAAYEVAVKLGIPVLRATETFRVAGVNGVFSGARPIYKLCFPKGAIPDSMILHMHHRKECETHRRKRDVPRWCVQYVEPTNRTEEVFCAVVPDLHEFTLDGNILTGNCFAIHAEANAFLHSDYSSKPTKLYVNGPPCFSCAKLICNSTIKDVFYLADENYLDWPKIQVFFNSKNIQCWDLTKWLHQN
jgi:deoxycytidylate deaminase